MANHHFRLQIDADARVEVDNFEQFEEVFIEITDPSCFPDEEPSVAVACLTAEQARQLAEHLVIAAVSAEGVQA